MDLRIKALSGCLAEGIHYQRLVSSSPLSPELFDQVEIDRLKDQAAQQAKSVMQLLSFKSWSKRKASSSRGRGAKRQRSMNLVATSSAQPQQVVYQQQQRQSYQQPYRGGYSRQANFAPQQSWQAPAQEYYYSDQRKSPAPSRGRGYRGRGNRGARSPATPRKQQGKQGF